MVVKLLSCEKHESYSSACFFFYYEKLTNVHVRWLRLTRVFDRLIRKKSFLVDVLIISENRNYICACSNLELFFSYIELTNRSFSTEYEQNNMIT